MAPVIDKDAKIPCPTPQHLQIELDALTAVLELREQEDTWEKMERAIIRFTGITRGGGYKHLPLFIDGMGKMGVGLKLGQCMLSDRGRLSGVATELLQTLAPRLKAQFQPLVSVYLAPLVQLLGRPNKVFLKRAEKCLWMIISNCHLPSILTELRRGLSDEAATCRRGCASGFERALMEWERSKFGEKGVGILEEALRKVGSDKDPEVRSTGKRIWVLFSDMFPERVDDFSAPLTPTIRRYLGVSAAASTQAGPSKSKPAPPRRPAPPALSASTSSVSISALPQPLPALPPSPPATVPVPPQPIMMPPPPPPAPIPRPHLLGGRAVRPPLLTTQSEALPAHTAAPAAPRRSPVRSAFPGGPAVPGTSDPDPPLRQRILSSRAPRYPPGVLGLAQHGRSVSHSVLPLPGPPIPTDLTPPLPDVPARPAFPTSFSTTSLPITSHIDEVAPYHPVRRFADGGARIVRPALLSSASEYDPHSGPSRHALPPITPSVLRGAVRSAQAPPAKRDLGQAQRRVVTAPAPLAEVYTPQVGLGRSTSVRDRIQEMERKAAEAAEVPLPISPVGERFGGPGSRGGTPKGTPTKLGPGVGVGREKEGVVGSPMMPMLARSTREAQVAEGVKVVELRDEEIPDQSAGDVTFGEVSARAKTEAEQMSELRPAGDAVDRELDVEKAEAVGLAEQASEDTRASERSPAGRISPITIPSVAEPSDTDAIPPAHMPKPTSTAPSAPAPASAPEPKTRKPPLPPAAPARRADKTPAAAPGDRLPPVTTTARAAKPRLPPNEARKPFRPTTKAALPAQAPPAATKTAVVDAGAGSVPKEPTVRPSKPPLPAKAPVARVPSGSKPPPTTTVAAKPPIPAQPRVVSSSSSNLTKPTAASALRAAPTTNTTSITAKPRVPSSSSTVLPPPVKKDKVKRKAAVPSFRPTRTTDPKGSGSLTASTASVGALSASVRSTGAGKGGVKEIVAKVRVKPEAVPLPISPGEKRAQEIPLPPSPAIGEFMGKVRVKVRPESLGATVEGGAKEEEKTEETGRKGEVVVQPVSPLAAKIPLPPSPTTSAHSPTTELPPTSGPVSTASTTPPLIPLDQPVHAGIPSSPPNLGNAELHILGADRTPISTASTAPAGPDWTASDSEDEEGEMGGVTFGARPIRANVGVVNLMGDDEDVLVDGGEEKDLIELSAPSRPTEREAEGKRDLIEFSAPSRPVFAEGEENELVKLDIGKSGGKEKSEGSSPRVVLSERDRNGVLRVEELI